MKLPQSGSLLLRLLISQVALSGIALAQEASSASLQEQITELKKAAASAQMAGDNAWMLMSSALVLMMTGPGLALFYGGLVRRKNVLTTMMQSFAMMAMITVIWALFGYSLAGMHLLAGRRA